MEEEANEVKASIEEKEDIAMADEGTMTMLTRDTDEAAWVAEMDIVTGEGGGEWGLDSTRRSGCALVRG